MKGDKRPSRFTTQYPACNKFSNKFMPWRNVSPHFYIIHIFSAIKASFFRCLRTLVIREKMNLFEVIIVSFYSHCNLSKVHFYDFSWYFEKLFFQVALCSSRFKWFEEILPPNKPIKITSGSKCVSKLIHHYITVIN